MYLWIRTIIQFIPRIYVLFNLFFRVSMCMRETEREGERAFASENFWSHWPMQAKPNRVETSVKFQEI